jgi:ElaB/YqjD/DUF883 family membrane-anchored ribosome-binding protein
MQTDTPSDTYSEQSNAAEDVRYKAEETASTLVDQAQQVASAQANSQMTRAASLLDGVAQSLYETRTSMREQQPQIASVADQAASRVEGFSSYLRDHDMNDVVRDAESYARREPLIFLGAAFAVGFIAARFLKASSPNNGASAPNYDRTWADPNRSQYGSA